LYGNKSKTNFQHRWIAEYIVGWKESEPKLSKTFDMDTKAKNQGDK